VWLASSEAEWRIQVRVEGTAAIVTGGGSGLGAATARLLARHDARVVVVDVNEELGMAVAHEVGGSFVAADVADDAQFGRAVDAAVSRGPLRVLVNCAGIGGPARTLGRSGEPADLPGFERVIRVNLIGTFNAIRLAAAAIAATQPLDDGTRGSILNTASIAAFDGQIGQASYSASKAGITGMTLPIARDLAVVGIRVNTIAPGLIDTPIYGSGEKAERLKKELGQSVLFPQRLGVAEEFASLAFEVLTNDYLNAEVIRLDGGARLPARS
jgi:NAD(P)-dependent dehydrogenase (short-subunit alcohol dehydrogenase family)